LTPRQKFTTGQLQGKLQVPQSEQGIGVDEGYGADPASKASAFQASHAYALEDRVVSGGYFYVVTTAGTSAGSAPTFPATVGASVSSGGATFTNYGRTGGGFRLGMLIPWTSGIRKHTTTTRGGGGGKGPKPPEQTEVTYDLDLAIMPGRGPLTVKKLKGNTEVIYQNMTTGPTGVPDPTVDPDAPYDPMFPDGSSVPYARPIERFSGALDVDGDGVHTGTIQAGSYANVAIYPGNDSQLPDPTIQSAVDALYGEGSTPAYRNRCLIVLTNFFLTKYGGAIPLIITYAEHLTIDTFELLFEHLSGRTGVLESTDYDYSGVRRLFLRGYVVTPPFSPSDVMEDLARVGNIYFTESDKIYARVRGSVAPVAALTSANLGWVDGETEDEERELDSLDFDIATETEIPRRVELTFVDPDRDYEQNSQGTSRQITSSEKVEKIELPLTLFSEEAREITQRELYEAEVQATKHSLSLDWSYLWLMPGDSITVAEDDGTTSRIFIESMKHCIGVMPVEGSAEETAAYSQPVSTSGGGVFEISPVPIPAMTIVSFGDIPALRTEDEGRPGYIAWVVKRAGDGEWHGAALYKIVEGEPQLVATFTAEATAGKVVTKLGLVADTSVEDSARTVTANSITDRVSLAAHGYEDGETVMLSNSGGSLPAGLDATTLYYVRDTTADSFKVSATLGGTAVDITSPGSGTHSVQRVVDVDLHDETVVLESVTPDQIANGSNACLFGNELLQVRTWERLAGYAARWRARDFTRGLKGTRPAVSTHAAGERFVLLNDAVKFVTQDIGELNTPRNYKAVTDGQSLDDAATVSYAWLGGSLRYPAVTSPKGWHDSDVNWRFACKGQPSLDGSGDRFLFEIMDGPGGSVVRPILGYTRDLFFPAALHSSSSVAGLSGRYGDKSYSVDVPGNRVEGDPYAGPLSGPNTGYMQNKPSDDRYLVQGTYKTSMTAATVLTGKDSVLGFAGGSAGDIWLIIGPTASGVTPFLQITTMNGTVYEDATGEASGTRYTIEILQSENKAHFYRNYTGRDSRPFYSLDLMPLTVGQPFATAASLCSWEDIGFVSAYPSADYDAATQEADFGSTQSTITVRMCQQRIIQGVVIDGLKTEVTFT
jgi:hypothetical protein